MQTDVLKPTLTEDDVKNKTPELFWSKISFDHIDNCWIWKASRMGFGYGQFRTKGFQLAHRFMYYRLKGQPTGLHVLHTCDNPSCVNPNHLILGSQADNMRDMFSKGRNFKIPSFSGEENATSKLTNEDVVKIKFLLSKKETQLSIAIKFGLSRSAISHIKNKHTWKHLTQ